MTWLLALLTALFLLDAARLRRRLAGLPRIDTAHAPEGGAKGAGRRILAAPGVVVPPAVEAAARTWAEREGLEVVDLVPAEWPALRALGLAMAVDATRYRTDPLAAGVTAGHAVLVTEDVLTRARFTGDLEGGERGFFRFARKLKLYAPTRTTLAAAPGFRGGRDDPAITRMILHEAGTGTLVAYSLVLPALVGFLVWAVVVAPVWGSIALAAWHLQPMVVLLGGPLAPRDLFIVTLLRSPIEMIGWARTLLTPAPVDERSAAVARLRPAYAEAMAEGPDAWFEPRRENCPLCGSTELSNLLEVRDRYQHKPGRFRLDRCAACGHIFQNPCLTIAGLEFYYRDFYDGLGEEIMERIFGYGDTQYAGRAHAMQDLIQPRSWLDVGAGFGHFALVAGERWPDARFEGLDLSDAVDEGVRRGWLHAAHRGLFPDLAADLEGRYDVVSMYHYLEHTRDPRRELDAAWTSLAAGGLLQVEVPDPTSRLGILLRSFWIPWFQPQHLHLLSIPNLDRLLREAGFTPIRWERGEAHQTVDFLFAAALLLDRIAPPPGLPWRRPQSIYSTLFRGFVWTLGTPLVALGHGLDLALGPAFRRPGWSNTYRVVARKDGHARPAPDPRAN